MVAELFEQEVEWEPGSVELQKQMYSIKASSIRS